jgi:Zn-dependent protease with chaperone function
MSAYARQSTTSRKKKTFRQPPCQDLVKYYHTMSPERAATDPLDKVRAQAYRDACRAAYFGAEKVYQAEEFVQELDNKLTGGQLSKLTAFTGGVRISWNKKFTATAGLTRCKDGFYPSATIELSEKLIDDHERLLNIIAHEFCHVANILISGDLRSHGTASRSGPKHAK